MTTPQSERQVGPSWQSRLARAGLSLLGLYLERASLDSMRRSMQGGRRPRQMEAGLTLRPAELGGVPVDWLEPEQQDSGRRLLYLHGGGWVLGLSQNYHRMLGGVARRLGARVALVDYRLAPEHPFPAGLNDCLDAYRALLEAGTDPSRIVIAGDSAGGNLTLAMLIQLRDQGRPLPAAAATLSAPVDLTGSSHAPQIGRDPILPPRFADRLLDLYRADHDPRDVRMSPLFADLRGLPPLLLQAGGEEFLRGDSQRFAEAARQAGVEVTLEIYPGMWHVWQVVPGLPETRQALTSLTDFIRRHAP